jgi:hypothetical protein
MELPIYQPDWPRPSARPAGGGESARGEAGKEAQSANPPGKGEAANGAGKTDGPRAAEAEQIRELKTRDREVRRHEQAHLAAGGEYAQGGASFRFQRGPDGQLYAVGGEVQLDASKVPGDPQATLEKAETLIRAALAPAEPSPQDLRVAAQARAMAAEARAELQQDEEGRGDGPGERGGKPTESREEAAYRNSTFPQRQTGVLLSQRV